MKTKWKLNKIFPIFFCELLFVGYFLIKNWIPICNTDINKDQYRFKPVLIRFLYLYICTYSCINFFLFKIKINFYINSVFYFLSICSILFLWSNNKFFFSACYIEIANRSERRKKEKKNKKAIEKEKASNERNDNIKYHEKFS